MKRLVLLFVCLFSSCFVNADDNPKPDCLSFIDDGNTRYCLGTDEATVSTNHSAELRVEQRKPPDDVPINTQPLIELQQETQPLDLEKDGMIM